MNGWVKTHRQTVEWEWYKEPFMYRLFSHLVMMANHKDGKWQGIEVKRGQLITGRKTLSDQTGISEQSIRTCLNKLKSTREITSKSTSKFSIITICNYDKFQNEKEGANQQTNQQSTSESTSNQPAINQQSTTNKNDKKEKNEKKDITRASALRKDFSLSQSSVSFAKDKGLMVNETFESFSDFHLAKGSKFKDWDAAWRTWCRNAIKFNKQSPASKTDFPQELLA